MSKEKAFKMHRSRLFSPDGLFSINCLALDEKRKRLAVLRRRLAPGTRSVNTGSLIEIWNVENLYSNFIEQTICENEKEPNLTEAVAWGTKGRLFSCGLNSRLNEYDLSRGMIKKSYAVTSGAAWCMDFDVTKTLVAVGTEEGFVCIFRLGDGILEDEVNFDRTMNKSERRILCVKWYIEGSIKKLVTGSIGTIKIWNYENHQCIDVIKTIDETAVIWCLEVTNNFVIVSGDSTGHTSFWNGATSTLIKTFKSHEADVLCISKGIDGNILCSGMDPKVMQFKQVSGILYVPGNPLQNLHTHEVRALAVHSSGWLYSGGVDVYLMKSFYPPKSMIRYSPDFSNCVHVSQDLVMFQYSERIEVWKLGQCDGDLSIKNMKDGTYLPLMEHPIKLLQIDSRKEIQKTAFANQWIAYSTFDTLKVLTFSEQMLEKVQLLFEPLTGVIDKMEFCGENHLIVSTGLFLYVLNVDNAGVSIQCSKKMKSRIGGLCTSEKKYAVRTADGVVTVYDIDCEDSICTLNLDFCPVFMKLNHLKNELWFASAEHRLVSFYLDTQNFGKSVKINEIDVFTPLKDVVFTNSSLIVYNENMIVSVKEREKNKTCLRYRHIVKLSNVATRTDELLVVEFTPEAIFKKLPKPLSLKKFGT